MSAGATTEQLQALHEFGMATGLAFQIIDDILDVTQTSEKLGKSAGKDIASEKSTYPALMGLAASRAEAHRLTEVSHRALAAVSYPHLDVYKRQIKRRPDDLIYQACTGGNHD